MTAHGDIFCSHCSLPVGLRPMQRTLNGEARAFCCYGCCIAFQVKSGRSEEWEAAWLLIRLGVGGFLSMNIMMFSLLLYVGRLHRRRCGHAAVDSPAALDLRDAGGGDSRRAVSARDVGSMRIQGRADILGARRARRRRRLRLFGVRHDRAAARRSISTPPRWC